MKAWSVLLSGCLCSLSLVSVARATDTISDAPLAARVVAQHVASVSSRASDLPPDFKLSRTTASPDATAATGDSSETWLGADVGYGVGTEPYIAPK